MDEEFSTKKEPKKTKDKRTNVNSLIDNSTNVQNSTHVNPDFHKLIEQKHSQLSKGQKLLADKERNSRLIRNALIDESLHDWIITGLVDQQYSKWVAKCCHILGLDKVNSIANNSRDGNSPQRLFASMLKAQMQLHYKREYEREPLQFNPDLINPQ